MVCSFFKLMIVDFVDNPFAWSTIKCGRLFCYVTYNRKSVHIQLYPKLRQIGHKSCFYIGMAETTL